MHTSARYLCGRIVGKYVYVCSALLDMTKPFVSHLCQPAVYGVSSLSTYSPKCVNLCDFDIGLLFVIWRHKVVVSFAFLLLLLLTTLDLGINLWIISFSRCLVGYCDCFFCFGIFFFRLCGSVCIMRMSPLSPLSLYLYFYLLSCEAEKFLM